MDGGNLAVIMTGAVALVILSQVALILKCYHPARPGTALVRTGVGGPRVSFAGTIALPGLHQVERLDLSVRKIEVDCRGDRALPCREGPHAGLQAAFLLGLAEDPAAVLQVTGALGCRRASDPAALTDLFTPKFLAALQAAARQRTVAELLADPAAFQSEVARAVAGDLLGFTLRDVAVHSIEATLPGRV